MGTSLDVSPTEVGTVERLPVRRHGSEANEANDEQGRSWTIDPDARGRVRSTSPTAKTLFTLLGLVLVGYAISLLVRHPGDSITAVDGWGVASFEMTAGLLVVLRGLTSRRDRSFGLWLGVGMCSWATGDFAMTIETLHGATPATLSTANFLWFGFFPLAYIGAMVLMRRDVCRFTVGGVPVPVENR